MAHNLILNEAKRAASILATCSLGDNPSQTLSILAKYYFYNGAGKNETRRCLEKFIIQSTRDANVIPWEDKINRAISIAGRQKIMIEEYIPVTASELEYVEKLKDAKYQRLLVALICVARYLNILRPNNNNWVTIPLTEMFSMACVRVSDEQKGRMMKRLRDEGIIEYSKRVDSTNVRVLVMDDDSEELMKVTDMSCCGIAYMMFKYPKQYFVCEVCGKIGRRKSNSQIRCHACARKRRP